jgi:hypothetical protein
MPSKAHRRRHRPRFDGLESRQLLSTTALPDLIASTTGSVTQRQAISQTSITIEPKNITPHKPYTIFAVFVQPSATSALAPRIVSVLGTNGKPLSVQYGRPYVPGGGDAPTNEAVAFVKVSQPGPLTVRVAGQDDTTGSYTMETTLPGDMNGDGQVTIADLPLFAAAYESHPDSANYNPAADFRQNGIVNLYDAKILMHNMTPVSDNVPLDAQINLSPADQAKYPTSQNSGGETDKAKVTIVGHTTPGSIVITDTSAQDYTFQGAAYPTNAKGYFLIPTTNTSGINNNDLLILDPFGRQLTRSYPILWIPFAQPHSSLGNKPGL